MMKIIANKSKVRIDKYLKEEAKLDISRTYLQKLIDDKHILVNDKEVSKNYLLEINDEITINMPKKKKLEIKKENVSLDIIFEDKDIAIVNKPKNMVVHPTLTNSEHTLVNALLDKLDNLSGINGVLRPGIVHRIDKDTTGLLMIAKTDLAHNFLSKQLKEHSVKRTYIALVHGVITHDFGSIDAPIKRSNLDRKKMAVLKDGKKAITHFKVLERFKDFTLLELRLETGRTHQIRLHLSYINHPVVGDKLYGPRKVIGDNGQFLHAKTLGFIHPRTKEELIFDSELPNYFKDFLSELRKKE